MTDNETNPALARKCSLEDAQSPPIDWEDPPRITSHHSESAIGKPGFQWNMPHFCSAFSDSLRYKAVSQSESGTRTYLERFLRSASTQALRVFPRSTASHGNTCRTNNRIKVFELFSEESVRNSLIALSSRTSPIRLVGDELRWHVERRLSRHVTSAPAGDHDTTLAGLDDNGVRWCRFWGPLEC